MKIVEIVPIAGLAWAVFGMWGILRYGVEGRREKFYSLLVLFCLSMHLVHHLLPRGYSANILYIMIRRFYFLTGPALYLYTRSLLRSKPQRLGSVLIHAVPYVIVILFYVFGAELFVHGGPPQGTPPRPPQGMRNPLPVIIVILGMCSTMIYSAIIQRILYKQSRKNDNYYSSHTGQHTLSWLKWLTLLIIPVYAYAIVFEVIRFAGISHYLKYQIPVLYILPTVYIFIFSFFARHQSKPEDVKKDTAKIGSIEKYRNTAMGGEELQLIFSKLQTDMEENKTFLDSSITIDELANQLGVSKHNLSQAINTVGEMNFYTFVNQYRTEEFKRLIANNEQSNKTIIALALDCGFSSSSTFYSFFKKEMGMTPKEFVKGFCA